MIRSSWIDEQAMANLARFANCTPAELSKVIVTEVMVEAAMEYVYSLYDPLVTNLLLEDIFRIMTAHQPRALEERAVLPGPFLQSHQTV
ncbi:hypothetical protein ALP71_200124 [Pseudomonas coronafaciens pv. garcae]|nr:hypothetical protein ALP71_200124 [Pseudomonas coronafaciens pv. garcae]